MLQLAGGADFAAGASGGGDVALEGVVHDHAVGGEAPAEGADGALHALDPATREAVLVALVEERDEFVVEDAVEVLAVAGVVDVVVGVDAALADGEAVEAVVGLGPPAVEYGEVEAAVEDDFLAAGAGGLEGTARIVEPDVDA